MFLMPFASVLARGKHGRMTRRTRGIIVGVAIAAVLGSGTVISTNAYLTDGGQSNGSAGAATLPAVATLTATKSGATPGQSTDLSWSAAPVSGSVTYKVQRSSVNDFTAGSNPATVYQGSGLSAVDETGNPQTSNRTVSQVKSNEKDGIFALIGGKVYQWGRMFRYTDNAVWYRSGTLTAVPGITGEVKQMAVGYDHECVLTVTAVVSCSGFNDMGQLGRGTTTQDFTAAPITDPNGIFTGKVITQVVSGFAFSCALTTDGTIGCWGYNIAGELGRTGSTANSSVPIKVGKADGSTHDVFATFKPVQISAVDGHVCALKGNLTDLDGNVTVPPNPVACWGYNSNGQLSGAVATGTNSPTPVNVLDPNNNLAGATKVDAGHFGSCALTGRTGSTNVMCWGGGANGILGNGTAANLPTATPISTSLTGFTDVSVGEFDTCGARGAQIICWGVNTRGNLGRGTTGAGISAPGAVTDTQNVFGGKTIVSVTSGAAHSCALAIDGSLGCWGYGDVGQLGQGANTPDSSVPLAVLLDGWALPGPAGTTVRSPSPIPYDHVNVSTGKSCGIMNSQVYCWGSGSEDASIVPAAKAGALYLISPSQVAASGGNTCAISAQQLLYCWGEWNGVTSQGGSSPAAISGVLSGAAVKKVVVGGEAGGCALTTGNRVACWGMNDWGSRAGDVKDGDENGTMLPEWVEPAGTLNDGSGVMDIESGGAWVTCAINYSYAVSCWGTNRSGALGNGAPIPDMSVSFSWNVRKTTPAAVSKKWSGNMLKLAGGYNGTMCGLTSLSEIWCWGDTVGGGSNVPVKINTSGLTSISSFTLTRMGFCAIQSASLYCWGQQYNGELGLGSGVGTVAVPTRINTGLLADKPVLEVSSHGAVHTCALTSDDHTLTCFGLNQYGALGINSSDTGFSSYTPTLSPVGSYISTSTAGTANSPICINNSVSLAGSMCSLTVDRDYYYRVSYSADGTNWVSLPRSTKRS